MNTRTQAKMKAVINSHEGLRSVLGLRPVEVASVVVDLHEDAGQSHGEVGVIASTAVGATGGESDVRLVVLRIEVDTIPAHGEVLEGKST